MSCDEWAVEEVEVGDPETGEVVVYRRASCNACGALYLSPKPLARCSLVCGTHSVSLVVRAEPLSVEVQVQDLQPRE